MNLEIQRSQYINVWKLFKGRNHMRKYGNWYLHYLSSYEYCIFSFFIIIYFRSGFVTNVTMAVTRVDVLFVEDLVSVMLTIAKNVQFKKRTEMVVQRYDEFHVNYHSAYR